MWAIVPFKGTPDSKSRLARQLTVQQRVALLTAMLDDVLEALFNAKSIAGILLVARETGTLNFPENREVEVCLDKTTSLGAAVSAACHYAMTHKGVSSTFVIPADVPMIQSSDIDNAVVQHDRITLIPDSRLLGTNGAICTPPNALEYVFDGSSYQPHVQNAKRVGIIPKTLQIPAFAHDVDSLEDLHPVITLAPDSKTAKTIPQYAISL